MEFTAHPQHAKSCLTRLFGQVVWPGREAGNQFEVALATGCYP